MTFSTIVLGFLILLWIGVVEVVVDDDCVVVVLVVVTLITVVEVGDVILTEPLFRLLDDEDVLFILSALSATEAFLCSSDSSLCKFD